MTNQLYTVTVTDLGTYKVNVAAGTPKEAENIAKTILLEEATHLPSTMAIVKREAETVAEPAKHLPIRQFKVSATYKLDFSMTVPAGTRQEAAEHAKRLYEENCGPFEFDIEQDRVGPFDAEEAVS